VQITYVSDNGRRFEETIVMQQRPGSQRAAKNRSGGPPVWGPPSGGPSRRPTRTAATSTPG
jgi:hypothetical protein